MKNEPQPQWPTMCSFILAISLAAVTTGLLAQGANPHNGTWLGKYTTAKGAERSIVLILSDGGGTWKNHVRIKQDTCLGRELPVTVTNATAAHLAIRINGSKFMPGCKDFGVRFSRTGDNTLEGKMGKGIELKLVRQ